MSCIKVYFFAVCLVCLSLVGSATLSAAPITLFQLVPNNSSLLPTEANIANSPTDADQAKNVTATTRTGGTFSAPFSGSLFVKSDGSNDGDRLTYAAGTGFFRAEQVARFNNPNNAGVLVWDFDMNQVSSYQDVQLFVDIDLVGASAANISGAQVYVSINDAEAGLSLDGALTPASLQTGPAIKTVLSDPTYYTEVATTTSTTLEVVGLDLDPFIAASDDGLLRLAVGVTGFRTDAALQAAGSRIEGVFVPEPSSVCLVGVASGICLWFCRRSVP